ncbi:MAG: TonB family protein [Geobacteraceae bacterium]|nr:TonB family protein [Geobacteraceae bacterium]
MNSGGRGIARLAPLLLVSLLLHLAVIIALTTDGRQPVPRGASSNMVVELPAKRMESSERQERARQIRAVPAVPRSPEPRRTATASAVPLARQFPLAGGAVQQGTTVPAQAPPVTPRFALGNPGGVLPGVNSGSAAGRPAPAGRETSPRSDGTGTRTEVAAQQQRDAYQRLLERLIDTHKEYPLAARRLRREGSCRRRFVLARNGSLIGVEALTSCGHPFLDEAASRAISAVGTFPPLPGVFKGAETTFTITMTFTLAR